MPRLIVNAVSAEMVSIDSVGDINIYVSVSRADNGKPVTGLTKDNFRITSPGFDLMVKSSGESNFSPGEPSGCYSLDIAQTPGPSSWIKGEYFHFGVEARVFKRKTVVSRGQTVVNIQSLGT